MELSELRMKQQVYFLFSFHVVLWGKKRGRGRKEEDEEGREEEGESLHPIWEGMCAMSAMWGIHEEFSSQDWLWTVSTAEGNKWNFCTECRGNFHYSFCSRLSAHPQLTAVGLALILKLTAVGFALIHNLTAVGLALILKLTAPDLALIHSLLL
jgi:hypothetical protein